MEEQQPLARDSNVLQEGSTNNGTPILRLSYKAPFPIRLRSTINTVAHFLRIVHPAHQDPEDAEEFLPIKHGYRFIDSYRDRLTLLYSKPETQHLSRKRWMVSEIRTYKDRKTRLKHEYLVATLKDQLGNIVLFRIQRRVPDSIIGSIGKGLISGSLVGANSTSPSAGSGSAKQEGVQEKNSKKFMKRAIDQTSIAKPSDFNVKQIPVEHIVFDPNDRVSLPELIILACTISDYSREYHLTQYNRYWFCYIAIEYLKAHYRCLQPQCSGRKDTWSWLAPGKVYKEINFEVLNKNYDRFWSDFEQEIDSIVNNPNNKYAREARELAGKEKQRAEELQKRIEGEARSRLEEKKRAEEAERRVAELEAKLALASDRSLNT